MTDLFDFITKVMHPESIIQYGGIPLLLFVIFAETGLFFGFFLPGDSLLFTSGLFCATEVIQMNVISLIFDLLKSFLTFS